MFEFNKTHEKLLRYYARPIVHMRKQLEMRRFGLVFGSGLSKAFGLPMWSELLEQIAGDRKIQGKRLLKRLPGTKSLPYQTELLFQNFKRKRAATLRKSYDTNSKAFEFRMLEEWYKIFARHLYADSPQDFENKVVNHPYFVAYLPIIRQTLMTVTYNFDNYIERALAETRSSNSKETSRGFETVTNPSVQFQRGDSVIYHPHGFFPPGLMEVPFDKFVFSEASYADQFAGVLAGDYDALINHFCKNTCLLIGLSLEDEMLRNLIVLSSRASPGNYHYHIQFMNGKAPTFGDVERNAIRKTNFNVYNLITLFLNEEEISALGDLINPKEIPENDIYNHAETMGVNHTYRFYLTGPLGVGKTTASNNFRNLLVLDEWLEERPEILAKPAKQLNAEEKEQVDEWIVDQFRKKNDILKDSRGGIFIIDRPPMDPLAFTPRNEQAEKASRLLSTICPKKTDWKIKSGTVILPTGDPVELATRLLLTGRGKYTAAKLGEMTSELERIYNTEGVVKVDTHALSILEVTKRVSEIIHLNEYRQCDIHKRLEEFKEDEVRVEI